MKLGRRLQVCKSRQQLFRTCLTPTRKLFSFCCSCSCSRCSIGRRRRAQDDESETRTTCMLAIEKGKPGQFDISMRKKKPAAVLANVSVSDAAE